MKLTSENYYNNEANRYYFSASQFKAFRKCEAAAPALLERNNKVEKLLTALVKFGFTEKDEVRIREVDERIEVTINGEYYGVWDTVRQTFVD